MSHSLQPNQSIDIASACIHFSTSDPHMATLVTSALEAKNPINIPRVRAPKEYFATIIRSIVSQQISVKAAAAVFSRLQTHLGTITPETIKAAHEEQLRACGLSKQKVRYLKINAERWHELPIKDFKYMSDEDVIAELTKLYGIGRWTAEMFLMFSLARPDVFSYGDLGLMQSMLEQYKYRPHWRRKITATVDSWSPHRTLAALTLWHHKDNGPVIL